MPVINILFRTRQRTAVEDAVNEFTRVMLREAGFFRQLLPPVPLTNTESDQLAPQSHQDAAAPMVMSFPGNSLPPETPILGPVNRVRMYPLHNQPPVSGRPAEVNQ